jgi:hypothetical protein
MLAVLVANAILAGALYFQRGTIPGLYAGNRAFRDGANATVIVEDLNVRASPGLTAIQFDTLPFGAQVVITGPGIDADGETWWPVIYGPDAAGYLWQEGIEPEIETGRARVDKYLDDALDWARTTAGVQ